MKTVNTMLLVLPELKLLTGFPCLCTLSNFLLLVLEGCERGNGRKYDRKVCFSFKDYMPKITACSLLMQAS